MHAGGVVGQDSPRGAEDAAAVYDRARRRVLLYGGKADDDVNQSDLWSFDLESNRWERIAVRGPAPPAREDHTLVLDEANDAVILFGGEDGHSSRETWAFDPEHEVWTEITDETAPHLESHSAIYDPRGRRMIVFGGTNEKVLETRTWSLDLDSRSPAYRTWSVFSTEAPRPSPRREHAAAYDPVRHRMFVFGGRLDDKKSHRDDLWVLDLESRTWTELQTSGDRPEPIRRTAMVFDPRTNRLTVFGGQVLQVTGEKRQDHLVNRIWSLDVESGRWTDCTPYPPPLFDHTGILLPDRGGIWVYGGSTRLPQKEHATWMIRSDELLPSDATPDERR